MFKPFPYRPLAVVIAAVGALAAAPTALAQSPPRLYWSNLGTGTIAEANLDGTAANQSFIPRVNDTYGVAVDGQHMYWTNFDGGTIVEADLDGNSEIPSFITGANGPFGLAVDASHIYWTNLGSGTIGEANLNGTGVNQNFITVPPARTT